MSQPSSPEAADIVAAGGQRLHTHPMPRWQRVLYTVYGLGAALIFVSVLVLALQVRGVVADLQAAQLRDEVTAAQLADVVGELNERDNRQFCLTTSFRIRDGLTAGLIRPDGTSGDEQLDTLLGARRVAGCPRLDGEPPPAG